MFQILVFNIATSETSTALSVFATNFVPRSIKLLSEFILYVFEMTQIWHSFKIILPATGKTFFKI
jgi:hypothetical protein